MSANDKGQVREG